MIREEAFGVIAIFISLGAGVNYIVSTARGRTKPHAFTWVIWSLIMGIVFVAQIRENAGAGAWTVGASTVMCLAIFIFSLVRGERHITTLDWLSLIGGLVIIPIWRVTKDPLLAVVLATLIDAFAYLPTARKSWHKPFEENVFMYLSDNVRWLFAFLAMATFTPTSLVYPIFCIIANTSLVAMIFLRRRVR